VGRAEQAWVTPPEAAASEPRSAVCRRIVVGPGLELLVDEQHPLVRLHGDNTAIADAVRRAMAALLDDRG
jgi:hypothetical protein